MNGVEILSSSKIVTEVAFSWLGFLITLCIVFVLFLGIGFFMAPQDNNNIVTGAIFGVRFGIIAGFMMGFIYGTPIEYEMQYKVTISDEVQMNSFFERYEILNQEGKIYTVREKLQK